MTQEKIAHGRLLVQKLVERHNLAQAEQARRAALHPPIYDEIYAQGVNWLNESDQDPLAFSGTLLLDKP